MFGSSEDAKDKFSLEEFHREFWLELTEFYEASREWMLNQQKDQLTSQKWVGFYKNMEDVLHEWVVCVGFLKEFSLGHIHLIVEFMGTFPKSTMGLQYFTLTKIKSNTKNAPSPMAFSG